MLLDAYMYSQSIDQESASNILVSVFQLFIPLMRCPQLVLPQCRGMGTRANEGQSFLSHQSREPCSRSLHFLASCGDIRQYLGNQLYRWLKHLRLDLLAKGGLPML